MGIFLTKSECWGWILIHQTLEVLKRDSGTIRERISLQNLVADSRGEQVMTVRQAKRRPSEMLKDIKPIGYPDPILDGIDKVNEEKVERENTYHKKKLLEMCECYDEDEVQIACKVFARRFPDVMYAALRDEHASMVAMMNAVNQSQIAYLEKTRIQL